MQSGPSTRHQISKKTLFNWGVENLWNYLKGTNFPGNLTSQVDKNYISLVLIFANDRLGKDMQVLIFSNLIFTFFYFFFVVVDGLQPVIVGGLVSKCAWTSVWSDGNDECKCCQTPTLNFLSNQKTKKSLVLSFH